MSLFPQPLLSFIECFGLEGTFRGHLAQLPCSEQGHLQPGHIAQSPVQPDVSQGHQLQQTSYSTYTKVSRVNSACVSTCPLASVNYNYPQKYRQYFACEKQK